MTAGPPSEKNMKDNANAPPLMYAFRDVDGSALFARCRSGFIRTDAFIIIYFGLLFSMTTATPTI